MAEQTILHGTAVSVGGRGVLLLGPPGSGKSDLALRLIDSTGRGHLSEPLETALVADDQVAVRRDGDVLLASAPERLRGLLEVRGLGLLPVAALDQVRLHLALELAGDRPIERMPPAEGRTMELLGLTLPCLEMAPFHASAPAWVRAAVQSYEG